MDLNEHNDANNMQMNDSWHIPRASLGGSTSGSSNSSSKSNSNPPTVTRHSAAHHFRQEGHANLTLVHNERTSHKALDKNRADQLYNNHRHSNKSRESSSAPVATKTVSAGRAPAPVTGSGLKRGSRSSQGSTDSNNSSHSASSGSMLLTAANLERFVAIQNKQNSEGYLGTIDPRTGKAYNSNIGISTNPGDQYPDPIADKMDTVIGIDPNLHFVKTKDVDAVSIASSTHFTMVNGMGGPQKKVKEGICSRGHQITVLILTMSMFFLIGILAMVYLLEMRAREMPQ